MLAAHIWKEETIRIEGEEEEQKQKGRRTNKTGIETTKLDRENETEQEETSAAQRTWEPRQVSKNMGFDGEAESSSRGERIRKREQYQRSCEEYKYPRKKDRQNPKIQNTKGKTETERGI